MGQKMDKIVPGLFLGSYDDSEDRQQIEANRITHILSIHENADEGCFYDIKYLCLKVDDDERENISVHFRQCIEFIHEARLKGGNFLVHCMAGISRSATITVAYLMTVTELSYYNALNAVKASRSIVSPNDGFLRQLAEFEVTNLKFVKEKLIQKFGQLKKDDHEYCNKLLTTLKTEGDKL